MGLDRVEGLGLDEVSKDIILHHHEHKDGTGYPDGTSLIRLNMETQIVGVADVWDAMTSERCYKHELSGDAALAELMDAKDRYYDHSAIRMLGLCNDK
jgi:HD-GYP domain-containing protein (c-di-GMP phosphodiesterase class II)